MADRGRAELDPTAEDAIDARFKAIWMYCMLDHEVGTLPSGPCDECVLAYGRTGPPDGKWNARG